ncbi:zinc ribbon domain-containing protein [Ruminococcus sp.]|uniref:zinc ribbon domain-containing protein n=1 Tax=Ruminococcus sp. TaxID=41978 RepID=UPI0025E81C5E|nr:zinc ribbon domain-containing protein [Ruminococcus sp.]MBQ9541677.1 zinc ribbon domain-containing protein [Ruminococcus sp.]
MFCTNCGSNIPDKANHCPNCGAAVGAGFQPNSFGQQTGTQFGQPAYVQPIGSAAAGKSSCLAVPARFLAKLCFLLALVCFGLPFISVSCDASAVASMAGEKDGDYSFEIVYKGYNLIIPSTIGKDNIKTSSAMQESMEEKEDDSDDGDYQKYGSKEGTNIWLILTFISAAAGLVLLFFKRNKKLTLISAVCGLVGFICLMLFRMTFESKYLTGGNGGLNGMENYLKVNLKSGFVMCLAALLLAWLASLLAYFSQRDERRYLPPVQQTYIKV